jgi:ubiquinone/menaquinone biosynthesis C-methylase UbiE
LEKQLRDVFDQIAPSWYNFRHRSIFKTELECLAKKWQKGKLINLGCGHGADFLPFKENFKLYGVDFSIEMLKLARKYAGKFKFKTSIIQANVRQLPFPDDTFDWAISIATHHHINGDEERLKAFVELNRILKPGAEAFITVWNKWQPGFWFKPRDSFIPWRKKDNTLLRYYHLFSYSELEKSVKKAGFEVIVSFPESSYKFPIRYFSRNICILIKKLARF